MHDIHPDTLPYKLHAGWLRSKLILHPPPPPPPHEDGCITNGTQQTAGFIFTWTFFAVRQLQMQACTHLEQAILAPSHDEAKEKNPQVVVEVGCQHQSSQCSHSHSHQNGHAWFQQWQVPAQQHGTCMILLVIVKDISTHQCTQWAHSESFLKQFYLCVCACLHAGMHVCTHVVCLCLYVPMCMHVCLC